MSTAFEEIDHYSLFLGHVSAACVATFGTIRSFVTVPNFVYCSGFDPCSCADFYVPLFAEYCSDGPTTISNQTLSDDIERVEGVEDVEGGNESTGMFTIIGIVTLVLIFLVGDRIIKGFYARERENDFQAMKKKLERQNISEEKMSMVLNILGVDDFEVQDEGSSKRIKGLELVVSNKFQHLLEDLGRIATERVDFKETNGGPKVDEVRNSKVTFAAMPNEKEEAAESMKEEPAESIKAELAESMKEESAESMKEESMKEEESVSVQQETETDASSKNTDEDGNSEDGAESSACSTSTLWDENGEEEGERLGGWSTSFELFNPIEMMRNCRDASTYSLARRRSRGLHWSYSVPQDSLF